MHAWLICVSVSNSDSICNIYIMSYKWLTSTIRTQSKIIVTQYNTTETTPRASTRRATVLDNTPTAW